MSLIKSILISRNLPAPRFLIGKSEVKWILLAFDLISKSIIPLSDNSQFQVSKAKKEFIILHHWAHY